MKPKAHVQAHVQAEVQKYNYQMSKLQLQSANVANTKKREGIDFYSTLNACWVRINRVQG